VYLSANKDGTVNPLSQSRKARFAPASPESMLEDGREDHPGGDTAQQHAPAHVKPVMAPAAMHIGSHESITVRPAHAVRTRAG
jgi:hypothetical protein